MEEIDFDTGETVKKLIQMNGSQRGAVITSYLNFIKSKKGESKKSLKPRLLGVCPHFAEL